MLRRRRVIGVMMEIKLSYSYWNELGIFYLLKAEDSFILITWLII